MLLRTISAIVISSWYATVLTTTTTASSLAKETAITTNFNIVADKYRVSYPQVIGHAGSSGYLPASTLQGYDLAAHLGADYSEPDLVLTSDNVFVASHDLTLDATTDIAEHPEYADRVSTQVVEGVPITGYYIINFTWNEIQTLRVRQQFEGRSKLYDWYFAPPSLQQIIEWQINYYNHTGRLVGIYPELKHPDWYSSMGMPMEDLLITQLAAAGYHVNDAVTPKDLQHVVPIAIQCFKSSSLEYLSTITNIPLVQLMGISPEQPDTNEVYTEAILDEIMKYAQAVAPDKKLFTTDWNVSISEAMQRRQWALQRGLYFVPWSFQQEAQYIPQQFDGDEVMEMQYYYGCLQSTAIFHEFPDQAVRVADECKTMQQRGEEKGKGGASCIALCPYWKGEG